MYILWLGQSFELCNGIRRVSEILWFASCHAEIKLKSILIEFFSCCRMLFANLWQHQIEEKQLNWTESGQSEPNPTEPNRSEPYECVIKCIFSHFVTWVWFHLDLAQTAGQISNGMKWKESSRKCWVLNASEMTWNLVCGSKFMVECVAVKLSREIWKSFSFLRAGSFLFSGRCMTKFSPATCACYFPRAPPRYQRKHTTGKISSNGFRNHFPQPVSFSHFNWAAAAAFNVSVFPGSFLYFRFRFYFDLARGTLTPSGKSA